MVPHHRAVHHHQDLHPVVLGLGRPRRRQRPEVRRAVILVERGRGQGVALRGRGEEGGGRSRGQVGAGRPEAAKEGGELLLVVLLGL